MRRNWNRDQKLQKQRFLNQFFQKKQQKKRKGRATDAERFKGVPVEKIIWRLSEERRNSALSVYPAERNRGRVCPPGTGFCTSKRLKYMNTTVRTMCPQCRLQDIPVIKKEKMARAHMLYGMVSAGTVAWVMYQKFCNGLPILPSGKGLETVVWRGDHRATTCKTG